MGVFAVSYMLKMLFEAGTNFMFLIVISNDHTTTGGSEVLSAFQSFVNLFDYENLSKDLKKELLDSVSLMVTKGGEIAENNETYEALKGFHEQFSQENYRTEKKK